MQTYATYRKHFLRADAVQSVFVMAIFAVANLAFLVNDRALFGTEPPFAALAIVRTAMFVGTLVLARFLLRTVDIVAHDRLIALWCVLLVAMFAYSTSTRPHDYIGYGAPSAAMVIGLYAMLTGPLLPRALTAGAISVLTFAFTLGAAGPVLGFNAVCFTHVAAHVLGAFVGNRISALRRSTFRAHQALAEKAIQLEDEKRRAEALARAKSDFLASMSHELRTPMHAVLGMSELLAASKLPDEQRGQVAAIRDSAQGLLVVLNDILDLVKVDAGKLVVTRAPFDLRALVRSIHDLFAPSAKARGLALELAIADDVAAGMDGDAARIRQVLSNLLANAVKFSRDGAVRIEVAKRGDRVELAVADAGPGISPALRARLFTPFEQGGAQPEGTGLGLAISKRFAEAMGGTLELDDSVARGARFVLRLPANEVALAPPAPPPAGPTRALRVLVADDNETNRKVARAMFTHLGHTVELVDDGEAAVAAVAREAFDLVCLDLRMPGMGGLAAGRAIRDARPALRIVALTASTVAEDGEACRAAGIDELLTKPLVLADLRRALVADPIDRATLETLRTLEETGKQPGFVAGLFAAFVKDAPALVDAICAGDAKAAHKLRSQAAQLGALALARRLGEIERGGATEGLRDELATVLATAQRLAVSPSP